MAGTSGSGADEVLRALDDLAVTLEQCPDLLEATRVRTREISTRRRRGQTYGTIVADTAHPLLIEMVREVQESLQTCGHAIRCAEARAMWAEGMSISHIAAVLRVSRQRASTLLR